MDKAHEPKPTTKIRMRPLGEDAVCDVHDLVTSELPFELVRRMREQAGVKACRACLERGADEANRQLAERGNA